jgi:hypothetical protein
MPIPTLQTLQIQLASPPLKEFDPGEVYLQYLGLQEVIHVDAKQWQTQVYLEGSITVIDSKFTFKQPIGRTHEEKAEAREESNIETRTESGESPSIQ